MARRRLARVLLVDNNREFIDPFRDRLIAEGWGVVEVAYGPEEAIAKVSADRFQICVIDKRLRDDHNPEDRSGIELAPKLWQLDGSLHFLMLTGFDDLKESRLLLQKAFPNNERRFAGYLSKSYGLDDAVVEVERIEEEALHIAWDLPVRELLDLESALEPILQQLEQGQKAELLNEADLLLRTIFYPEAHFRELKLSLLDAQGRSGARLLRAQAKGRGEWVLKLATRLAAEEEWRNYRQQVQGLAPRAPEVQEGMCQVGKVLGVLAYSRIGELDPKVPLLNLGELLRAAEGASDVRPSLRAVVQAASFWSESRRMVAPYDLTSYYVAHFHLEGDELPRRVEKYELELEDGAYAEVLPRERVGGEVVNPLLHFARSRFVIESAWCICHGDLNATNILMPGGQPWLIDFASTGVGPAALDWITLEASLKLDIPWQGSPPQWFALEEGLVLQEGSELATMPEGLSPELQLLWHTIITLRAQVMEHVRLESGWVEYLVGLFYATLAQLRFHWHEKRSGIGRNVKHYRALASAGLIAERLMALGNRCPEFALTYRWSTSPTSPPTSLVRDEEVLAHLAENHPNPSGEPHRLLEAAKVYREGLLYRAWRRILGMPGEGAVDLGQVRQQLEQMQVLIDSLLGAQGTGNSAR